MKLLAFADSHSRRQNMLDVVADEQDGLDAIFFLGDGMRDAEDLQNAFPSVTVYTVQGNCDPGSYEPYEGLAPFGGMLFFYCHGHTYNVKSDLELLWWKARRRGADAALFGHTHVPYYEFRNGMHLFNPGSISMPRFGPPSYGRILVENDTANFEIVKFSRK